MFNVQHPTFNIQRCGDKGDIVIKYKTYLPGAVGTAVICLIAITGVSQPGRKEGSEADVFREELEEFRTESRPRRSSGWKSVSGPWRRPKRKIR